jgi:hypothetical protein
LMMNRKILTGFICPTRWTRSMAWSSTAAILKKMLMYYHSHFEWQGKSWFKTKSERERERKSRMKTKWGLYDSTKDQA